MLNLLTEWGSRLVVVLFVIGLVYAVWPFHGRADDQDWPGSNG